jgi:hypothetical protein
VIALAAVRKASFSASGSLSMCLCSASSRAGLRFATAGVETAGELPVGSGVGADECAAGGAADHESCKGGGEGGRGDRARRNFGTSRSRLPISQKVLYRKWSVNHISCATLGFVLCSVVWNAVVRDASQVQPFMRLSLCWYGACMHPTP